jgi:hypothetical protein
MVTGGLGGGLWLLPGELAKGVSCLVLVGEFPRELESSRGEALQGCVCWRSPRGFSTRAALHSGIANEYAGECLT